MVVLHIALLAGGLFPSVAAGQDLFSGLLAGVEVMIGESVAASVIEEYGPPVRLTPGRQQWVDTIFGAVTAQASRSEISYSLQILHTDVVNAFAAPGGYLFVTTGLLQHIGDDADALANVLGHEVAHVELKHGMNALMRQVGIGLLLQLVLGDSADETWLTVLGVATELMRLGWSREQEHESDELGQRLAAAAGFSPDGMVRFFEVMQRLEGQEVAFLEFLRTHPLTSDRIDRARQRAASLHVAGPPPGLPTPASPADPAPESGPASESDSAGGPRVVTRGSSGSAGETSSGGAGPRVRSRARLRTVAVENLFTITVPVTWSVVWERESTDHHHLAELQERDGRALMGLYLYEVDRGTTAMDTAGQWLAWLQENLEGVEVVEPVWRRRLDRRQAASFIAGWTEEGESWILYGTTVVVGTASYEFGIALPREDLVLRRPLLEQIVESWRLAR